VTETIGTIIFFVVLGIVSLWLLGIALYVVALAIFGWWFKRNM